MESKCPVCRKGELFPGVSITECLSKSCAFRCNLEDLPRIAAAMELARATAAKETKHTQIISGDYDYYEDAKGELERAEAGVFALGLRVLEVFGGDNG